MLLGGTSNHFRTRALHEVGGWDAWNVTEDADLGLRLARMGYDVEVLPQTTHEEVPAHISAWFRQRRRWFKGWIQTFVTHSRRPLRLVGEMGILRACAAFFLLGGGLLGSLSGPLLALMIGHDILFGDLLAPRTTFEVAASSCWLFICITGLASALWPAILGARRRRLRLGLGWLCCLPLRYLLLCCAAWTALFDFFDRPFYWAKTEHGLARTSRHGKLRREDREPKLMPGSELGKVTSEPRF
jgi:cellulose synthase/poly-beta-1,6-N-acetylglucosamine synthase-like glycosyltransferase